MRSRLFIIVLLFWAAIASLGVAQEKLSLTVPVFQSVGTSEFRVQSIFLQRDHPDTPAEIRAIFREVDGTAAFVPNGKALPCRYSGTDADTLIRQLNITNLSTTSLEKRVTQRCQADGKLGAGTITGIPQ